MEEMKVLNTYKNTENETVFVTNYGDFTKKRIGNEPGFQTYLVTILSGRWPNEYALGVFCDARYAALGGSISIGESTATVTCNS